MPAPLIALVAAIPPMDAIGENHRVEALSWLRGTEDVYRRVKPATPSPHLVTYAVLVDRTTRSALLCDHRLAGLWLPTGGHVEAGEDPEHTVRRETEEELGIDAVFDAVIGPAPFLLTVTETVGAPESRHTDVTLWYAIAGTRDMDLRPDPREVAGVRWWTRQDVETSAGGFEPHLGRAFDLLGL